MLRHLYGDIRRYGEADANLTAAEAAHNDF